MPFAQRTTPEHHARLRRFLINTQPSRNLAKDGIDPSDALRWVNALLAMIPNATDLQITQGSLSPEDLKSKVDSTIEVLQKLFGFNPSDQDIEDAVDVLTEGPDSTRTLSLPLRNRPAQQRKEAFERTLRARAFVGK